MTGLLGLLQFYNNISMASHRDLLKRDEKEKKCLADLLRINFKEGHFLANSGKHICTVPFQCMEELLSSMQLVQVKNHDKNHQNQTINTPFRHSDAHGNFRNDTNQQITKKNQQESNQSTPIKVGQIFYIQFYFSKQYIYYDHHNNKLVLSRDKHTAFKIIEHISKNAASNQEQTVDFIGNVVPNQNRYLIVIANEILYLKYAYHSVYMGTYDEKCIVTFSHSMFKTDKNGQNLPLLSSPCRLYSVQQQKYIVFDTKNREIVLKKQSVCIQGMCAIETADFHENQAQSPTLPFHRKKGRMIPQKQEQKSNQVSIRVLQGNYRHFLTHRNSSNQKLTQDLAKMLHPMEERLNNSNTFLLRFQPSLTQQYRPQTTFNLSNISNIQMAEPLNLLEQEEKEEIIEQLTLREISFKGSIGLKEQMSFMVQLYPSYNAQYQLFIYDSMVSKERIRGREVLREKQLYLDFRQIVASGKQQCVLKEYSSQKMKRQSPKFKSILRVQFITRDMLTPFLHYYSLLLNLKVYNYHRQPSYVGMRGSEQRLKMRLNLQEIQDILAEFYASIQALAEVNKDKSECLMRELLQINFIGILEELLQAIIIKKQSEERQEGYKEKEFREHYPYQSIQSAQIMAKLLLFIGQTMPDRLIYALLRTNSCLLFIRICKLQQINSFFSKVQFDSIDDPQQMLKKLQEVIEKAQLDGRSMCRNICILWAFRIMKKYRLQNDNIQNLSQRLIKSYKGKLTEEYLIVLQLIKVSKGEQFYSREVVKFLPLQRLQQEEIPYSLRQAYFRKIIHNYQDGILLPFRSNLFFINKSAETLQQDNQRILRNFLQEVLPKNSKFQTIENKLFALLFVELYLCFGGDFLGEITIEQLSCRDYLPQLIVLLEEQLQNYLYEPQHQVKFVMQLLKCHQLALQKEIRYIVYEEKELCLEDEELIVNNCLQQFSKVIPKKVAHATSRSSLQQRDSVNSKLQRTSKAQKLLNLFSKQKRITSGSITRSIDKQIIWKQINDSNKINTEQRLDIFEGVLNIATLLLSPSLRFRQYYHRLIPNPHNLSPQFIAVVKMISNKAYYYDFWNLVQRLSYKFSQDEWRTIIGIINSNKLLTHFILYPHHEKPSQRQLITLYSVLNQLLLNYIEWTNSRIAVDYSRNENQDNYVQIYTNYHHYPNDLQPDNFIYLLAQVDPSYLTEQMTLHESLVHSIGTITNIAFYNFYSQYIVRYQCQHFHNSIINLSLTFMDALTPPLRTQFANNFQYSLFKQSSQLKALISQLSGVRQNIDNKPQRATNFNILTQLKDQRISKLTFSSEDSEKEFLIGLFRLLGQVQTNSSTHKQILPKLGYPVIISVLGRYSVEILLKHEVLKFLLSSIEKQMAYGLNKYLKKGKQEASQCEQEDEDCEEHAILLEFVKQTNYLLQRQTQTFKGLKLTQQQTVILVSYVSTLLSIVRIRDNILDYLKFERTERIYRSDSGLSDVPSMTSRSISSQQSSFIASSIIARQQQAAARVRQMMYQYNSVQIDESQVENIEGINKLLCYQAIQALDTVARTSELPPSLQKPLHWVQTHYKISLANQARLQNEPIPHKQSLYKLDKSYLTPKTQRQVHRMNRNTFIEQESCNEVSNTAPNYEYINQFLSLNVQGYLVLLIELLQRHILAQQKTKSLEYDGQITHLMILLQTELIEQIRLYKLEDEQFGKQDFEVLPQQFYKRFGYQSEKDEGREKQHQKCCEIPEKKLQSLFQLLLVAHRLDRPIFLLYLLNILEKTAFYNINNQTTLQSIISTHFQQFYQLVFAIIYRFRTLSPILDNSFFTVTKLLDPEYIQWQKIYSRKSGQKRGEGWVQGLRGMQGFHLASLNFYMLVKMLLAYSRSLNFQFKSLFARPTIERQSILSEIIDVLSSLLRNFSPPTQEKMQFTLISLKLVNNFLRGPVQPNIQIALNRNYSHFLLQLLDVSNKCMVEGMLVVYLLRIKRLVVQGLFILIPFIRLPEQELGSCQDGLRQSYIRSKKAYDGQFDNIISDYVQKKQSNDLALLYFQLALNFYYCLIQIYAQRGNTRILDVQVQLLARERIEKGRRKNWRIFYQIYEVIVAIVEPIYRRLRGTYEELTDERSEEELLRRAIAFFTKHVSQIEVKVYGKTKKISFLLPQQASCYNVSIRKQFYRLIGREQRELRLNKFMKISKYIIIRLQIIKTVRKVLSNFKPLEVIVQNRQLWKSLCFLNALLLNIILIFVDRFNNLSSTLFLNARYGIVAITFLFIVFLYLIYFLEVLPLKLKVYSILRRKGFTIDSLLIFVRDKTLGFALFYTIFLVLSFFMLGFVSVLLCDYFSRFKVSSKISFLMFRSIPKIFYVVILLFTLLYVVALLAIRQEQRIDSCIDVVSCTQSLFFIFMNLRFNVQLPYQNEGVFTLLMILLRMFTKIILLSLLVGIIIMEKRKDDQQAQAEILQVRDVCFICGGQRNAIEKARNSNKCFDMHVEMDHNLWNYINYLVYLKKKQRKNLNAIEGMVIEHWDANKIDWLPDSFL